MARFDWQVWLYVFAVLIPLAAAVIQVLFIRVLKRLNAYIATGAILTSFALSVVGFLSYAAAHPDMFRHHEEGTEKAHETETHAGARSEPVAFRDATTGKPIGALDRDLAALADDPAATLKSWARGDRRQVARNVRLTSGKATITASKVVLESNRKGGALNVYGSAMIQQAPKPSRGVDTVETEAESSSKAWTGRFEWVALGGEPGKPPALAIPLEFHIDNLAVIMFLMVTFVAGLIHIYSMGYMRDDPRYPRFFAYLSLFCFSMLGLVASGNVFMIFMFWELVGVCSYLLIGFWYEEKKNADAANKAFIVNRVGDVGMLVGLGLIWATLGTFNIAEINRALADKAIRDPGHDYRITHASAGDTVTVKVHESAPAGAQPVERTAHIPFWVLTVAGLGIFAGCVGKSAQFPLHVWLPDAMAGPTPVSALIHAATMVAAGVYLVGRFFPLFTDGVLLYIAYTGGVTLFIAATIAMVQTDYKKVLAYSTVSQLGYMMLGLGVGGWSAGLFHLLTHAFFKALLFLGAGSVYHAVHTYEMPVLGGLYSKMRTTALTMGVATLAISGVPVFSGFFSKDAILASSLHLAMARPEHAPLFVLPAVGAAITAFYMFRLWLLIFHGEPRGYPARKEAEVHDVPVPDTGHGHEGHHHPTNPVDHAHESEPIMTWPLILLAIPTVFIGLPLTIFPGLGFEPVLENMLAFGEPVAAVNIGNAHLWAMGASVLVGAAGIAAAMGAYSRWGLYNPRVVADRFGGLYKFLVNKWYFDELYDAVLVRPTLLLSRLVADADRMLIDGIVNGSAAITERLSALEGLFDQIAVDGLVNLVAKVTYATGDRSGRWLQTGRLRNYLMILTVGVIVLFVGVFLWIAPRPPGR
ncbi:MAG TPA: NADH-quinone oxidoreductase subunit L [Isosphaeraceae bacterium]|jgi:proton-translocating NADH-quinone oxidoreductase chain L|nr:NADH-quinone oxidoreductase subunit L [Isosphaeraceae bacterium]